MPFDKLKSQLGNNGLIEPGNVNLYQQPEVKNPDGSISTVDSSSYNIDGVETLLPSVTPDGRHLINQNDILNEYRKTGRHLGKFQTPEAASTYAEQLHNDYAAGKYKNNNIQPDNQINPVPNEKFQRLKQLLSN